MNTIERWDTDEKEPILRERVLWTTVLMVVIYGVLFFNSYSIPQLKFAGKDVFEQIYDMDFSVLYDCQINLLVTAISTLALVTSLFKQRYLGKNYRYWCFKKTVFCFTPQEIIVLMVFNQFAGMLHLLTGKYRAISLVSAVVCWGLFMGLMHQVYVYVVKVSRLFVKIRKRLDTDKNMRSTIRNAMVYFPYESERNQYITEEVEIILYLLKLADKERTELHGANPNETEEERQKRHERIRENQRAIKDLKQALIRKVENHAFVCCGCFDCLQDRALKNEDKDSIERVMCEFVKKVAAKIAFTYNEKTTAKNNLVVALEFWCPANRKAD